MIQEKQEKDKAARFDNLINYSEEEEKNLIISYSPQMLPEQESSYHKLKINGKKIDKILDEIVKLKD